MWSFNTAFLHLNFLILLFGIVHCTLTGHSFHDLVDTISHEKLSQPISNEKRFANVSITSGGTVSTSSFNDVSQSDIENARAIVQKALTAWGAYNKARFENPHRNIYTLKPEGDVETESILPSNITTNDLEITEEVASAAALLAELEAVTNTNMTNATSIINKRQSASFWMEQIDRLGTQPYGGDPSYKVFRNVVDYGAKGDGTTDDTAAINKAIKDGNRCGAKCYGSSTKNAIVYFPAGTYLVSTPIIAYYGTQMIGNANNLPTIKASKDFIGLGVISTDVYTGGGKGIDGLDQEYYINTANFFRQIRNFAIDITATSGPSEGIAGIHYQVSQATSLFNVKFICSQDANTKQTAIFAENGSGGFMSDLTFQGGKYGIHGGNQQFTSHRLTFTNVQTAIWVIWDWGWTWKNIHISGCTTGFNLTSENGKVSETGSLFVQDSVFENTANAIVSFSPSENPGTNNTGITLDNVQFKGVTNAIIDKTGKTWLAGSVGSVDTFVLGPIYDDLKRQFTFGTQFTTPRQSGLVGPPVGLPKPMYFERIRTQYENLPASQFVSMKKNGAKGDGATDDTAAFQNVINQNAGTSNIIFVDAGSYVLTDTIKVPPGAKIVGELWAQLVASGPKFSDDSNPRPLFQVGQPGQVGSVEIQDLLFTTVGETKGLITVEWNLEADAPGSAAMWDCHVRIGGAIGSQLTSKECPPVTSGTDSSCIAGSLMFHITSSASAYLENVWLWGADHDLDDSDMGNANNTMTQLSVYVARGMLIESKKPTWLYGTASEHSTYYQYSFYKAENIHAGMIQTESPYYQPNPLPPAPFTINTATFPGDPDYKSCQTNSSSSGCDSSWSVRVERSANISFAGAGLYSWFTSYNEACVDTKNCQKSLVQLKNNGGNIQFFNLITIGSTEMVTTNAGEISAEDNLSSGAHPFWTQIGVLRVSGDGMGPDDPVVFVDPTVWVEPNPTVQCTPPCILVLPPSVLSTQTTISLPPYVTTLEVGWMTTVTVGGSVTTEFTGVTQTTTLSIPPITTNTIDFWNVPVSSSADLSNIIPTPSIVPSPFTITDSYPPGVSASPPTRVITPPAYPYSGTAITSFAPVATYIYDGMTILVTGATSLTTIDSGQTIIFGPTGILINGQPLPSPTSTTTTSNITIGPPLPYFTFFPGQTVSPVTTPVPKPTWTVINGKTEPVIPCNAWFFFICIDNIVKGIVLFGFELPGIYPPGGPPPFPPIPVPPGIDFPPKIIWPAITIGSDGTPTYDPQDTDDEPCETTTVSSCSSTVSQAPTTTTTITGCETATGCKATDSATTTTTSVCSIPTGRFQKRAGNSCGQWAVVYPVDNVDNAANSAIDQAIRALGVQSLGDYYTSQSAQGLGTMFWSVERMTDDQIRTLKSNTALRIADIIRPIGSAWSKQNPPNPGTNSIQNSVSGDEPGSRNNMTMDLSNTNRFQKRAPKQQANAPREMVLISRPPGSPNIPMMGRFTGQFTYDDSAGKGQTIYALEYGATKNDEISNLNIRYIYTSPNPRTTPNDKPGGHGTCVAAKLGGNTLGIARAAQEIVITVINWDNYINDSFLDGLLRIYDDIVAKGRQKTSVVNLSIAGKLTTDGGNGGIAYPAWSQAMIDKFEVITRQLLAIGVTVVCGSGNDAGPIVGYPALFGDPTKSNYMEDLIVVGGVQAWDSNIAGSLSIGGRPASGQWGVGPANIDVFAPAVGLTCPNDRGGMDIGGVDITTGVAVNDGGRRGTSFATPTVAGLAAYFKALNSAYMTPSEVKEQIMSLSWSRNPTAVWPLYPPIIWNGEGGVFCANPGSQIDLGNFGAMGTLNISEAVLEKRQNLPSGCSLNPTQTNPANNPSKGPTLTFHSGTASPTCLSGCGILCSSDNTFCATPGLNPSNPDFFDPLDPRSPQNPANPSYSSSNGGGGGTTSTSGPSVTGTDPANMPLPTVINNSGGSPLCFRNINGNGVYKKFNETGGRALLDSFCKDHSLDPGNTNGYDSQSKYSDVTIHAVVKWAADQTGCQPKKSVPMGDWCQSTFAQLEAACDNASATDDYGGGFVDDYTYGCIVWTIWADATPPAAPGSTCNCNEDGCTPDSPPCCANGTCHCDCNENSCTPDSPPCCANGSCNFGPSNHQLIKKNVGDKRLPMGLEEEELPRMTRQDMVRGHI